MYVKAGLIVLTVILSGCAAMQVAIEKKDLDVQAKMSDTVFLDPVGSSKKTIFVLVRNTSDKSFEITSPIREALAAKGYRVTDDPDAAYYILQANILQVGKSSPSAAQAALQAGYGGLYAGAAAGAIVGGATHGWVGAGYGGAAGALIGGVGEVVANSLVKDVSYVVITDIEISERTKEGVIVRQDQQLDAKQGMGGGRSQTSSEIVDFKKYRTRIVSTANKVNLEYDEAEPQLTAGIIRSISGLF